MPRLMAGDTAPGFALPDTEGRIVRLADFAGHGLIIWFFPEAGSPGCSDQAHQFRDASERLTAAGYQVVGISRDSIETNRAFKAASGFPWPILSDPDLTTHLEYDTFGEKSAYGKTFEGVRRSTIILNGEGDVVHAFYNTKATNHLDMLRKRITF